MQHVTVVLDSLPAGTELDAYHRLTGQAVLAFAHIARTIACRTYKQQLDLLQTPNVVAAVRVLACIWYAHTLLPKESSSHPAAAAAAAVSTADQQRDLFSWRAAAIFSRQVDPPQAQEHFEPVRRSTGVSMHAAAYAAALTDTDGAVQVALALLVAAPALSSQQTDVVAQLQQQQQLTGDVARCHAVQAEDNLLLLQLLLCSLEQQPDSLGCDFTGGLGEAAKATATLIPSLALCHRAAAAAGPTQKPEGSLAAAASPSLRQLVSRWFACVLPTLLALLQHAQQHLSNAHTGQAAASCLKPLCNPGSSSSRAARVLRSALANRETQLDELEDRPPIGNAQVAMWLLLLIMAAASQYGVQPVVTREMPPAQQPGCSEHCVRICSALDACLRLQVSTSGGLKSPVHACQVVQAVCMILSARPQSPSPLQTAAALAGPGSKEQQQLFSMLASLLKVCRVLQAAAEVHTAPAGGLSLQATAGEGCMQPALVAASFLTWPRERSPDMSSSVDGAGAGKERAADMAAAAATGAAGGGAAAAGAESAGRTVLAGSASPAVIDSLPALVLVGRCCLLWVHQLQQQKRNPSLGQRLLLLKHVAPNDGIRASKLLQVDRHHALNLFAGPMAPFAGLLRAWGEWLSHSQNACALVAAGYPAEHVSQQLHELLDMLQQPAAAPDSAAALAAFDQVVQQLQAVGLALNTLAFPHACNNPFCSNMSGATEVGSVSGRGNMCAGCLVARYCSKACQTQHWKQHKPVCKALRVAAVCNTTKAD